ncbi:MAG: hypothetical protein KJO19_06435 [Woeseia sp.]|nr:hypothetical protein [Woeseia sp.]MBT8096656.1 hypothetical protein [Woeseia sp.]
MVNFTRLTLVAALLCAGCAATEEPVEDIEWSSQWFQCESRFDCVAVYDAYCKYTGVNTRYLTIYQDWARQQVERSGELMPCEPVGDDKPLAAYCHSKKCEHR